VTDDLIEVLYSIPTQRKKKKKGSLKQIGSVLTRLEDSVKIWEHGLAAQNRFQSRERFGSTNIGNYPFEVK
jgi:hypothetical protein